jgi:hypothetical protein
MSHLSAALAILVGLAPQDGQSNAVRVVNPAATSGFAMRATEAPVIDGKDDDAIWRAVPANGQFREFQPREDGDPRYETEWRAAYDDRHLYVFIRAFDPAPDSILSVLSRRDVRGSSDQLKIVIDSYHDRRTGYEFAVNPAGVKRDYSVYDDGQEDDAWDGVWDVGTQIDSLGWTAEFAVPLSQLRYAPAESNTFGFGVWRDIERHTERVSWPVYRVSRPGLASQLGELSGLTGLPAPRRLEVSPYVVAKSVPVPVGEDLDRQNDVTGGADLKYGVSSNLTLVATVNPDFGQIEADPAVLNLSAFETFFQERRPFFVEGTGMFQFDVNCNVVNCQGENLFYSRRIGRAPQLAGAYGDGSSPTSTTILGAGKFTGRLPSGLSLAVLEAVTRRAAGTEDRTIEPLTNYAAVRAQQDLRGGESNVGIMVTGVKRDLDEWTDADLRRDAYAGALDFRHRFLGRRFQVSGAVGWSRVRGSAAAIDLTQRSSVHFYQRPDADLPYDPARTRLSGDFQEIKFGKVGGNLIRFETSYQRRSPGLEVNDLGYLRRAGQQSWSNWMALQFQRPTSAYRRAFWNFSWWQSWTTEGLPLERAANTNLHAELPNRWWMHAGGTVGQLGGTYDDRAARGGPALRTEPFLNLWSGIEGDQRPALTPYVFVSYSRADGGRSRFWNLSPEVRLRIASRFSTNVGLSLSWNRDDSQWYGNFADQAGATHYTFARLEQRTTSLDWRMDYTITPELSVQLYAQPFVSKGTYSDVRELADPRALAYDDRFRTYGESAVTSDPGGFNVKQFRSNLVLRWEYRPGSTLFLVWNQGREDYAPVEGTDSFVGDFRTLFRQRASDIFLIKASYWINW